MVRSSPAYWYQILFDCRVIILKVSLINMRRETPYTWVHVAHSKERPTKIKWSHKSSKATPTLLRHVVPSNKAQISSMLIMSLRPWNSSCCGNDSSSVWCLKVTFDLVQHTNGSLRREFIFIRMKIARSRPIIPEVRINYPHLQTVYQTHLSWKITIINILVLYGWRELNEVNWLGVIR